MQIEFGKMVEGPLTFLTENRRKFNIHKQNGGPKAFMFGSFLSWKIVSTAISFSPGGRSDSLCDSDEELTELMFD